MSSFAFSFGGDDIDETTDDLSSLSLSPPPAETGTLAPRHPSATAFPVANQPLLPAKSHTLEELLAGLPSKIAYSTLRIDDDDATIALQRRELWDVRVQLMAEDEEVGLGSADVKTGIYEGGFKSWESSVDLVRELAGERMQGKHRFLELGCGTALPSLAILQRHLEKAEKSGKKLELGFADYNPSVLRLVTVPNILLTWAASRMDPDGNSPFEAEGELDIDPALLSDFTSDLARHGITLSFFSGAWGATFASLVETTPRDASAALLVLAAETIYSPSALQSFAEVLMRILGTEGEAEAMVAAKKVYFGVGGSMEDFCERVVGLGGEVKRVREEVVGVRREVVMVSMKKGGNGTGEGTT